MCGFFTTLGNFTTIYINVQCIERKNTTKNNIIRDQKHYTPIVYYLDIQLLKKLQRKIIVNLHITQAHFMRLVCGNNMKAAVIFNSCLLKCVPALNHVPVAYILEWGHITGILNENWGLVMLALTKYTAKDMSTIIHNTSPWLRVLLCRYSCTQTSKCDLASDWSEMSNSNNRNQLLIFRMMYGYSRPRTTRKHLPCDTALFDRRLDRWARVEYKNNRENTCVRACVSVCINDFMSEIRL